MADENDTRAIAQILAHYCHLADTGQVDEIAALFADNGVVEVGTAPAAKGSAEVHDWYKGRSAALQAPAAAQRHRVSSVSIDVDGKTAACLAYFDYDQLFNVIGESFGVLAEPGEIVRVSGKYELDLVSHDGQWSIIRLRIDPFWTEKVRTESDFMRARHTT